jgi:hypothetical protein
MTAAKDDIERLATVAASRAESREADRLQRRREAPHRAAIIRRHAVSDWPLDARTLERANLEAGDVRMPATPAPPPLEVYRTVAESAAIPNGGAGTVQLEDEVGRVAVDPTLVIYRHNERARERAALAALVGPTWTLDLVARRIEEAFATLFCLPELHRPRGYGTAMPTPIVEMADLVARAENGSLSRIRARLRRRLGVATQAEQRRMGEALAWPVEYLAGVPDLEVPLFVNLGGMSKAMGVRTVAMCREIGVWSAVFYKKRRTGLEIIARGLADAGRAPT